MAVEPSAAMRAGRAPGLGPVVAAVAESLPLGDRTVDAAMAVFSVHQWPDLVGGLAELRRVTRGPVVVLTCDPDRVGDFWLAEYAPEVIDVEARRYPPIERLAEGLGGPVRTVPVAIPVDCRDGFNEAYFGRPEVLLDPTARSACSAWSFVAATAQDRFEARLRRDLDSGRWDDRFGHLRTTPEYVGSLVLVVHPAGP